MTGGAGFIGSHTVDLLIAKGYKVTVLDNLATVIGVGQTMYRPVKYLSTNTVGTANMYEVLLKKPELEKNIEWTETQEAINMFERAERKRREFR
jgi:nucleoside-diphosphate-sugar epimerase